MVDDTWERPVVQGVTPRTVHHAIDGHSASAFMDAPRSGAMVDMGASYHSGGGGGGGRRAPVMSVPRALGFGLLIASLLVVGVLQHSATPSSELLYKP